MTRSLLALFVAAALLSVLPAVRADQAKAEPGAKLDQLSKGTHIYGPKFDADALLGKVVVVNIGGG